MATTKWTRKRWYRAKHLSRLLTLIRPYGPDIPQLVDDYIDIVEQLDRRDPLADPIRYRLALHKGEVPF